MTTYVGTQNGRAIHSTQDCGNAWIDSNKVTPAAALATTDVIVALQVPAGVKLEMLRYYNGDFDTGTTLAVNIGYRTRLPGGTATSLTYFASASTVMRAATTAWQELVFEPVKFDEPVEIVFIPSAAATGVTGTPSLFVQGMGAMVGIS